jgi:hypothetical protein
MAGVFCTITPGTWVNWVLATGPPSLSPAIAGPIPVIPNGAMAAAIILIFIALSPVSG